MILFEQVSEMIKPTPNNKGFTLIETLAAVAIIAVISLAAFTTFGSITNLANYTSDNQKIINSIISAMDGGKFDALAMVKESENHDFRFEVDGEDILIHTNTVKIDSREHNNFALTACNYASSGGTAEPEPDDVLAQMKTIAQTLYDLMVEADTVWDTVKHDSYQRLLLFNSYNASPSAAKFRYYVLRELGGSWPELPLNSNGEYPDILYYSTPLYIQVTVYNPKNNHENTNIVVYVGHSTYSNLSSLIYNHEDGNWYIAKSPYTFISVNQPWANIKAQITGSAWKIYIPE